MQGGTKQQAAEARAARLAEALRENLKRRKSQARGRKAAPDEAPPRTEEADADPPGQE